MARPPAPGRRRRRRTRGPVPYAAFVREVRSLKTTALLRLFADASAMQWNRKGKLLDTEDRITPFAVSLVAPEAMGAWGRTANGLRPQKTSGISAGW